MSAHSWLLDERVASQVGGGIPQNGRLIPLDSGSRHGSGLHKAVLRYERIFDHNLPPIHVLEPVSRRGGSQSMH